MAFRRITVFLDEENEEFVKWLAERDNKTVQEELRQIFWTELDQLEDLYKDEMKSERGK